MPTRDAIIPCSACSLRGEFEKELTGENSYGCRLGPKGLRCKIAPTDATKALSFNDIRAVTMILYSCNSASMTADRCPTDTSISSCLGDGYPSGWIIVRGEIYTPGKWHLLAAPECLRRGAGLGDIARLQNDTVEALDGWRPLVLVGDPASEMHAGLSPGHLEAVALARQDQPVAASAVIRGVGQDGRDVLIYRAENTLISERTRGVEIVDCERDISLLNKWFIAVARRSQCARDLEAALLNLLEKPGVNTTTEFETHYGELCRTHANVDHYLSSGMVRLRQSKKIGVWLPILTECEEQCRRHVGLWERFRQ